MFQKDSVKPKTVCEVGCGAGEVLKLLQEKMDKACSLWGCEISPQAFEICKNKANAKLQFKLGELNENEGAFFEVISGSTSSSTARTTTGF